MDTGRIVVIVGLIASGLSILAYLFALRGGRRSLLTGRITYGLAGAAAIFCFGYLMTLVASHRFEYKYVFDYSSADLKFPWNYAATWAGQQGSFLLWAFWTAIIGGLVMLKAGKWETRVMPMLTGVLGCLFVILLLLDPYTFIPRGTGDNDYPMDLPWPPQDGMGLNASLQNIWMAIHPPTIFFGFASLAVPFVYAMAAMIWRDYSAWTQRVMPYVLMSCATLGVGLFMGGYWAYETQGWHGFWAWDPVENASLFPWLAALGLLHGLVVQKSRGGMGRTNVFLSIFTWVLFLWGTFLTRSGILANFSVHSFGALDNLALYVVLGMIGLCGISGVALLLIRWRSIPGRPISDKLLSRDSAMVLAVTVFTIATLIVLAGTSWPLLSSKFAFLRNIQAAGIEQKEGAAQLLPLAYNQISSFLAIPLLLLMGAVPFLAWGKTNPDKFISKALVPWFASLGVGCLIVAFIVAKAKAGFTPDTPTWVVVIVGTLASFAAISNIMLAGRVLKSKAVTMGGWLSHVGMGVLIAGAIITNVYEETHYGLVLEDQGILKTPFGYGIEFAGWTHDAKMKKAFDTSSSEESERLRDEIDRKDWYAFDHGVKLRIVEIPSLKGAAKADEPKEGEHQHEDGTVHSDAEHEEGVSSEGPDGKKIDWSMPVRDHGISISDKNSFLVTAPVFKSRNLDMNRIRNPEEMRYMRWPYIHVEPLRDFYVSIASDPKLLRVTATLKPGETGKITMPGLVDTGYQVHYKDFYFEGAGGDGTNMGANIDVITPEGKRIAARPGLRVGSMGASPINTQIDELNAAVVIDGKIDPKTKVAKLDFELPGAPPIWMIPVAVTNKPFINLVWLGIVVMGAGMLVAMTRRSAEARKGVLLETSVAQGIPDDEPVAVAAQPGTKSSKPEKKRQPAAVTRDGH